MKILAVLGAILLVVTVAFVLFFWFSNRGIKKDLESAGQQIQRLTTSANSHQSVRKFLNEMAQTKWTELEISPSRPEHLNSPEEIMKWQQGSIQTFSITNIEEVLAALEKTPKGTLTFTNPKDNPIQYDRSFFRLEYENDRILSLSLDSL